MSEQGGNENAAIAQRAYEIWEAEGKPHGRDREHWEAAAIELGSPAPMPENYRDGETLPGLEAASKKPAPRRKKATVAPESGASADAAPKPPRRKRTTSSDL